MAGSYGLWLMGEGKGLINDLSALGAFRGHGKDGLNTFLDVEDPF
jgi:hypothetical protein